MTTTSWTLCNGYETRPDALQRPNPLEGGVRLQLFAIGASAECTVLVVDMLLGQPIRVGSMEEGQERRSKRARQSMI
ncbi:MAG: hypothetical protein FalmKO_29700 [Falsiruegeria mediterranea]